MRSRSKIGVVQLSIDYDPPVMNPYILRPSPQYPYDRFQLDASVIESMDDYPSKTREVKVCTHVKADASTIPGDNHSVICHYIGGGSYPYHCALGPLSVIPTDNPTPGSVPWSEMAGSLSEKLKGNIRSKTLLAVSIRELPQTIGMIKNPFRLLRTDWRKIAGRFSTAKTLAKEGANLWLETQYGWKALSYDLANFAKSYGRILSYNREAHDQEAQSKALIAFDENRMVSANAPYQRLDGRVVQTGRVNIVSRGCYTHGRLFCRAQQARASLGRISYVLNSLGLSNRDILASLWEVVPFSFVADWFIKLPNLLAPLDYASLQSTAAQIGHSLKTEWSYVAEWEPGLLSSFYAASWFEWEKPKLIGLPGYKRVYSRIPGFNPIEGIQLSKDLSSTQLTSLGSLLIQAATGKPKWH